MAEVLVYVTAASRDHALLIGRQLVEERLAACVNVLGPIASIYRWEGEVCEDEEVAFIVKTRTELVTALSEGADLVLRVRDTGAGLSSVANDGTHFGVSQVRERLATLYGEAASLTLSTPDDAQGGTLATVRIPLNQTA